MNSLTTLTIIFNFVGNIWNFGTWSNLKTYLEHIAWENSFPKDFFLQMRRIFKISLLSLEWQWGLLALNVLIFFKNVMKEIKIRSNKKHLNSCPCIHIWLVRIRRAVKQIFNLDHWLYILQKYVVCKSQAEVGHSLNFADFTDFL